MAAPPQRSRGDIASIGILVVGPDTGALIETLVAYPAAVIAVESVKQALACLSADAPLPDALVFSPNLAVTESLRCVAALRYRLAISAQVLPTILCLPVSQHATEASSQTCNSRFDASSNLESLSAAVEQVVTAPDRFQPRTGFPQLPARHAAL